MFERAKCAYKLLKITNSPIWLAALECVKAIQYNQALQEAAKIEPIVSFCPQCGQRPQDDRRKDEARKLLVAMYPSEKRRNIDVALSLAYIVVYK